MRETQLITVFTADTCAEAEAIIGWLRSAGLHPAELGLTTPFPFVSGDARFPLKVPVEEREQAHSVLEKELHGANQ